MKKRIRFLIFICSIIYLLPLNLCAQQNKLQGTVYDHFSKHPLEAVTVQTASGSNAITDSSGKFMINITKKDSVWFSYLSKKTMKYSVDTITDLSNFEIALYVDAAWLPAVKVKNSIYKVDSLNNRNDYAKIFNFRKPGLSLNTTPQSNYIPGSVTVGLNLEDLINMFRFKRNRQILTMQERLITEEQDKYINHRFTKYLVQKLTLLSGKALDSFINISRPSYELLQTMNEIELGYYIQQCHKIYQSNKKSHDPLMFRKEE